METLAALMAAQPSLLGALSGGRGDEDPPEITKENNDLLHLNFGDVGDEEGERAEDDDFEEKPVLSAENTEASEASTSPVDSATPTDTPKEGATPCVTPVNGGPPPMGRSNKMDNFERKILQLKAAKAEQAAAAAASSVKEEERDDGPVLNTGLENAPSAAALAALSFDPSKFDLSSLGTMGGVSDELKPLLASGLMALMKQTMGAADKKPEIPVLQPGLSLPSNGTSSLPVSTPAQSTTPKRKRQRRNPVWPYFDVVDGTARCKQCPYSTKSVFSTNLKVHLRSHHRADYEKVIEAEDALNLNALLLSNGAGGMDGQAAGRKRTLPPMTNSFLMTINKLAKQNPDDAALNSVLRQTLMKQATPSPQVPTPQPGVNSALPAALQAAAAQLARNQLAQMAAGNSPSSPLISPQVPPMSADSFFKQFQFPTAGAAARNIATMRPNGGTPPFCIDQRPQQKRRRLRRHPVWMFYRDLEDRMVGCINCDFKTGSAFSTNLKMHLKAHHKEDYAKVLKLEDEMRIEEGVFGPPNKMKSDVIDFIRSGGNASTPTSAVSSPTIPQPSQLVRNFISQTSVGRQQHQIPQAQNGGAPVRRAVTVDGAESFDEDNFMSMSTQDRLAALVGLMPTNTTDQEENENAEETTAEDAHLDILERLGLAQPTTADNQRKALEELRKAAERIAAANGSPSVDLPSTSNGSEAKTSSASSMDGDSSSKTQNERDRALTRFWLDQGGNEQLLSNEAFKEEESFNENEMKAPSKPVSVKKEELDTSSNDDLITKALLDTMSMLAAGTTSSLAETASDSELTSTAAMLQLFSELGKVTPAQTPEIRTQNPDFKPRKGSILSADEADLTPEERARRIAAERMRIRRANETPEEREIRLQRMRARYRARVANETEEQKEARRRARRSAQGEKSATDFSQSDGSQASSSHTGTPEPSSAACEVQQIVGVATVNPELAQSLNIDIDTLIAALGSDQQGKKKREITDEEKSRRLEKMREYQRRRLQNETPEQREKRLEKMRNNQRQRREKKMAEQQQTNPQSGDVQEFVHALAPDYRIPDSSVLTAMATEDEGDLALQ